MAAPVVELHRIEHDFGERPVLRGVELRIEPAASVALFGDNGAGKTTLLRIVAGLLRPSRGEARIEGVSALTAGPALRRRVGFLSHRPLVWGGLTANENLRLVG
ncbi:MAG: heme exporter protein, partial [Gaiellales bacterium]|nr:heme exporter protein [Gaiellales bacterium]